MQKNAKCLPPIAFSNDPPYPYIKNISFSPSPNRSIPYFETPILFTKNRRHWGDSQFFIGRPKFETI